MKTTCPHPDCRRNISVGIPHLSKARENLYERLEGLTLLVGICSRKDCACERELERLRAQSAHALREDAEALEA